MEGPAGENTAPVPTGNHALNLDRRQLAIGLGAFALGAEARAEETASVFIAEVAGRLPVGFGRAVDQGADYLACDFTPTRDGVLVAGGPMDLAAVTDIAFHPEFTARKSVRMIDAATLTGWFVCDFDWSELATLTAGRFSAAPRPDKTPARLLNLRDVTHWARAACIRTGRVVGVHARLNRAAWFANVGAAPEEAFANGARAEGYDWEAAAMQVECEDPAVLRNLRQRSHVRRLWTAPRPETLTAADLRAARAFAHGLIVPDTIFASRPEFVGEAAAAGLKTYVRTTTNRSVKSRLPPFGRLAPISA